MIVTSIATHATVIALEAVLVINMTTGTVIASQLLVTAKARVTIPNTVTDPDQEHDCNQGPILIILEAQDTIMVTTFMMMTTGEGNGRAHPLPPLVQDQTKDCPLLEPNLLLFNIGIR